VKSLAAIVAVAATAGGIWVGVAKPAHARTIHLVVPVGAVHARRGKEVAMASSYIPRSGAAIVRQDAFGVATFGVGVFFGAITLKDGQIVYGGATDNQDAFSYAILGGSGTYAGAAGTVTLKPLSRTKVSVTIAIQ
jgi:hypothetical protein